MRSFLRWSIPLLLFLATVIIGGFYRLHMNAQIARSEGEKQLEAVLADLDANEPGWRFETFFATRNQALAPPEKNAAYRLHKVYTALPADFMQQIRRKPPELFEETPPNQLLSKQAIRDIRAILDSHKSVLDDMQEAVSDLERTGFVLVPQEPDVLGTLINERDQLRFLNAIPRLALFSYLEKGDGNGAIRCVKLIMDIEQSYGDEPLLIVQLYKMAFCSPACSMTERILACSMPDADLVSLQSVLEQAKKQEFFITGLRGERLLQDKLMQNLENGSYTIAQLTAKDGESQKDGLFAKLMWTINRGYVPQQRAKLLEWFTSMSDTIDVPYPGRRDIYLSYVNAFKDVEGPEQCWLRMNVPAIDQVSKSEQRIKVMLGTAVAAIACERFRLENKHWPKDLNEIPKAILKEVPTDLFTGKPLLMKRTKTGLVIYSTGVDGIDNGGEKLSSGLIEGTDLGFRLYDPEHRRQKAPEEAVEPKPEP